MGRIDDLIQQYCPEGVEYVKLGDYCPVLRGKRLTKSQLSEEGKYKVFHGGIDPIGYYDQHNREANTAMVINVGASAGTVGFSKEEFWSSDGCFCLQHNKDVNNQFLFYYLQTQEYLLKSRVRHAGIPTLDGQVIEKIEFPLPPLPVQEAIVEILEKFDRLSAELQAELQARKQQYEYYRNQLLTRFAPEQPVTEYSLGELGTITKGAGILKSDFREQGYPCIHYGQVHTYYGTFAHSTKSFVDNSYATKLRKANHGDLIIASTSEDVEACCKACAWMGNYKVAVSGDAHIYSHNQNPKYMAYLFQTEAFAKQKRLAANGAKVVRVKGEAMAKFRFVFPSLEEQARIVAILDKFEALVNDLSQGLPAEIAAVQEQYEYYRNKLLTFKTKE